MKADAIVKAIYAITDAAGIPGVIAGGSARDVLHDLVPKDYDFVVYNLPTMAVINALRRAGQQVLEHYTEDYGNSDRFEYCVKARIMGVDVDFIGLTSDLQTPQHVVETFDFCINQAWFSRAGTVEVGLGYPAMGDEIMVLRSTEITEERTMRLAYRFPQYDWADAIKQSKGK